MNSPKSAEKTYQAVLFTVALLFAPYHIEALAQPEAKTCKRRVVDNDPVRIEQARQIIEQNRLIVESSKEIIAQANNNISESKKLQGQARQYTKNLKLTAPLLKGKALQDAKKQFSLDLADFSKHVQQYRIHTEQVRKSFGQCKASQEAFEKMKKDLALHCDQFHMKDVEPPHICLEIDTSLIEAMGAQSKVQQQAMRVAQAQMELEKTEARLQKSIKESGLIDKEVMLNSALALKEQELAAEFGRLKEEHRQLDIARKALQRSGVRTAVPAVKGRVRK